MNKPAVRRTASAVAALCAAAIAQIAIAALPSTAAGTLDPSFGSGGLLLDDPTPGARDEGLGGGLVQPDGKVVLSGSIDRAGGGNSLRVSRFLADGTPDPAFAGTGHVTLALDDDSYADSAAPALDANGRVFVVGGLKRNGMYRCFVAAFRPDGSLDPAFGEGGVARTLAAPGVQTDCNKVVVQADGKPVALARTGQPPDSTAYVIRFTANGTPDASFGTGGVAKLPYSGQQFTYGVGVGPDGSVYAAGGFYGGNGTGFLVRFTPAGVIDKSFGSDGIFSAPVSNVFFYSTLPLADGSLLLAGYRSSKPIVMKVLHGGQLALGFGAGGIAEIAYGVGYSAISMDAQADGKIVTGLRLRGNDGIMRLGAARLTPDGVLDPSFGNGGLAVPETGVLSSMLSDSALGPDGKIWMFGYANIGSASSAFAAVRLLPDEITTPVVEFHNAALDHYFITANPGEASAIDAGAAGPGWARTGQTFKSGGPDKAGRFYGNPEANPATGARRGPNSHFYSLEPAEIAAVKTDIGWKFESYDFNAWPRVAGACPQGTTEVLRAYNKRFAQNDSNHRYTISPAIYQQMVAAGWSGEGAVFCAPL